MKRLEEMEMSVEDFVERAKSNFGSKNVTSYRNEHGLLIIEISNGTEHVSRKDYKVPEYRRKQGD